jgi:hypothetical protein
VSGLLSHHRLLVDAFYDQVTPERVMDVSRGMEFPGTTEPRDDRLAFLTSADVGDPRLVQLAAAALYRYRTDDEFRQAVDAELPEIERLAQELNLAN